MDKTLFRFRKILFFFFVCFSFLAFATEVRAENVPSFVTVVNPVRGAEFWDKKDQKPADAVLGELNILNKYNLASTWLLRYDSLSDQEIISMLKSGSSKNEVGLFLEITPSLSGASAVKYHQTNSWHSAGSIFLSGYSPSDREKLIDYAFEKFKGTFGFYPRSVGAWWIDSYSLEYMQKKYSINASLEVADQYTTDNYQIWGQYWGTPYYPAKKNALIPAQDEESKIPVTILQWAARDPIEGFGNGVEESTYSTQPNDYIDYHKLDIGYFEKLVDLYTKQSLNQFNQLTVGLENSYSWKKYSDEYEKQIALLAKKTKAGQFSVVTMSDFSNWYTERFPITSPEQIIVADDPLGSDKKTVWFMNNFYRAGWFYNQEGSIFRDIRQYIRGSEELCLKEACDSLNFASSATRVLDDVSFGQKWVIDQGKISNFIVQKLNNKYELSYKNEAGKLRLIDFLPRDLSIDGKNSTIDGAILDATKSSFDSTKSLYPKNATGKLTYSITGEIFNLIKSLVFLIGLIYIPGVVFIKKFSKIREEFWLETFLSMCVGLSLITLASYILGYSKLWWLIYLYGLVFIVIYLKNKLYKVEKKKIDRLALFLIVLGSAFQIIPTFKSGMLYDFGLGFWGPNGHDGVWHIALINQLIRGLPPQSPILGGEVLKNYHFFYDLLIAATHYFIKTPVEDLIFRFYPAVFSILLGIGTYYLSVRLFKSKISALISMYLVYFSGSFGWIVEFIKQRHFGGESAFWANQAVSFNLNPPFAISLVLLIGIFHLLLILFQKRNPATVGITVILVGTLFSFKSYAAILVFTSLFITAVVSFLKNKQLLYLKVLIPAGILSAILSLPNITIQQFFIFSPFWLVNSMIDFPDRVGWIRLATAREAYFARGEWLKFILVELLGLFIFVVGNLGIRFFGLFGLKKIGSKFENSNYLFFATFILLSLLLPSLFLQQGNGWNIIQFFYYFMFMVAILAGTVMAGLVKNVSTNLKLLVFVISILIAPVNSLVSAKDYFSPRPAAFIDKEELSGLNFLSQQPQGLILTYPFDKNVRDKISDPKPLFAYDSTAYVSAFSKHAVFVEDEIQNDILQTDYIKKIVLAEAFFKTDNKETKKGFLRENNIKYIFLNKYFNVSLSERDLGIKKIFENSKILIYEVI